MPTPCQLSLQQSHKVAKERLTWADLQEGVAKDMNVRIFPNQFTITHAMHIRPPHHVRIGSHDNSSVAKML